MDLVASSAEAHALIEKVKRGGAALGTNFFLPEAALERAVLAGEMAKVESYGSVVLVKREEMFHRVYYAAVSPASATEALRKVPAPVLVADLVGRPVDIEAWASAFIEAGFDVYTRFQRMLRIPRPGAAIVEPPDGTLLAGAGHVAEIRDAIVGHFDAYAERIPTLEEVRHAVESRAILIARHGDKLAAILYFEDQGVSTHLRYWLAMPAFRGCGYAHMLMLRYLYEHHGFRRFVLWVEKSNIRAIPLYERYGYSRDGVEDIILRKPAAQKRVLSRNSWK